MKCPHCLESFHGNYSQTELGDDIDSHWILLQITCPACNRFIINLFQKYTNPESSEVPSSKIIDCYPRSMSRLPLSKDVPDVYKNDYKESCLILANSPKASAAMSRRCLQNILREEAGVKNGNLANEIQQVLDQGKLPSHLLESLDAIRNIGNLAAHPIKSNPSGEIIDVEPGEAEWNLDVLESLFDYFFVQPAILKKKRDALNKKLKEAGKPEMKSYHKN